MQPANVKVSESGEIALVDFHCYEPQKESGYKRMVGNYTLQSPISPQLMKPYVTRAFAPKYDEGKNDVWGFGVTMICAATISNFREFYDFTYGNIHFDKLNEKLDLMHRIGYSEYIIKCVTNMLNQNEEYRPSMKDLANFLRPQSQSPVPGRR